MLGPGVLKKIPQFVRAKTPESLREEMLRTNIQQKGALVFFDIQFVENFWYAWFTPIDVLNTRLPELRESLSINGPAVRKK